MRSDWRMHIIDIQFLKQRKMKLESLETSRITTLSSRQRSNNSRVRFHIDIIPDIDMSLEPMEIEIELKS